MANRALPPAGSDPGALYRGRSENEYRSRESLPPGYAKPVPRSTAPKVLLTFTALAIGLLWLVNAYPPVAALFPHDALILAPARGENAAPIRIFILAFLLAFCGFAAHAPRTRLLMTLDMALSFLALCMLTDLTLIAIDLVLDIRLSLRVIEILGGLTGFAVFALKMMEWGRMPSPVPMAIDERGSGAALLRILIAAIAAIAFSRAVLSLFPAQVSQVRQLALLGGIGPGLFLVFPAFFLLLFCYSWIGFHLRRDPHFSPDLTVLVAALNEDYIIADCIRALDAAAAQYGGAVRLILVDNGSTDATVATAQAALTAAEHLDGEILHQPEPGKSMALNTGLERIETAFFIRIDADTLVCPESFTKAASMISDPEVGAVGGIPLPPGDGPFDRSREFEVYIRHGFYNVAFDAINGVTSIPGMFALYRTALPKALGGFVHGMNGEDTDMSLRIGEMGFQLIVSPSVRYYSEVPASYAHLREQRMRWFRSTLHFSSRCRALIYSPTFTIRGKLILPFMLINLARRAMMVPLVIFGYICLLSPLTRFDTLSWSAAIATFVGAPAVVAVVACLLNGSPGTILHLPRYILFRLLRAYLTLESMLSMRFRPTCRAAYGRAALAERGSKPDWIA
ncbi:glycosyltransferase family 2 protein [Salipiger bermudensis]|uniref:glycosyltransferase n=1 Tax=Salipiger bermudensis TaxID=344736 RepID=UPI001C98FA5B|nr:glycosyltransferase [Salipiger bermudensis]MBY6003566.1 glycosyltransferase family 2 protein [Salipiger bermudensis]